MDKTKEFLDICHFKLGGKLFLPSCWQWFWNSTIERWRKEGMPSDVHVEEYFGFDRMEYLPVSLGLVPTFETKIIEEEVKRKVGFLIEDGGYFPSVDHSVPPDVPFENFMYYMEVLRKNWGG